jgi:hypothetical protein
VDQPVAPPKSCATPASMTDKYISFCRANTLIAAPPARKVLDHLPGHILRIGRDAGLGCAVIAGENQHLRLIELRVETLLDQADLFGDFFELTEGAERLGLLVDLLLQAAASP